MKSIRDAIVIVVVAAIVGFAVNAIRTASGGGLPLDTPWPDNRTITQLEFPMSYDSTMDSLVTLEQAYNIYLTGNAIFLDAREEQEYDEGHIKGAYNLPFEFWDDYWTGVEPYLDKDKEIVAYCGGLDCELSLFEARELKSLGYEKAYTFFGGWQKWEEAGLPIETTEGGEE